MNTLLSHLASSIEETPDLVLYIGAGACVDLAEFGALQPRQCVFVEGDPLLASQLARSLGKKISCRVVPSLVTADGEKRTLYRYNLPFLNGVFPLGELEVVYPRLKVVEAQEITTTAFADLLKSIPLTGDRKRILILDIPGQEAAVLDSVGPEQLRAFEWILLRGAREALQPGAQPAATTFTRLEGGLFDQVFRDEESDPAWPVSLFRFDRRMGEFHQEMENRTRLLAEMTFASEEKSRRILELENRLQASQGELDGARQQLGALSLKPADTADAQNFSLNSQLDSLRAQLTDLASQFSDRGALLGAAHDRLASMENDLAPQKMLLEVLTKGRAEQDALYQELTTERDGLRLEIQTLKARRDEMEELLADKATHGKLIDMEFQKVEGQIDLIKDIFLRERR